MCMYILAELEEVLSGERTSVGVEIHHNVPQARHDQNRHRGALPKADSRSSDPPCSPSSRRGVRPPLNQAKRWRALPMGTSSRQSRALPSAARLHKPQGSAAALT